ncbi:MAG TPA: HTTM domain-containing protein, partial [Nannocystis sp.]
RREASTTSAALLRIAVVLLLWTRWAADLTFVATPSVALSLLFFIASSCLLIGFCTRVAAVATAIAVSILYFWFGAHLGRVAWIHHHHYLLVSAAWICALTPCGRSLAIDARGGSGRGPVWALRLYTLQLAAVYLWSGVDKLSPAFLSGARLEQLAMDLYFGSDPPQWHLLAVAGAWLVMVLELALGLGFLLGKTPRWLLLAGIGLHATIYLCMPVATFSATMVCLYLAALDPEVVHRTLHARAPSA